MGLITKLFGGILAFLGSIFKVFNIFKKSEYFLEADDAKSSVADVPPPKAVKPSSEKKSVEKQPAAAAAKAEPSNGKIAEPAATLAAAAPVNVDPKVAEAFKSTELFAPNYLVSSGSNSRRRPGPSLNRFMDMAKQVKG